MPSCCHYRGDRVADLEAQRATGHLFGPDICGPDGRGAHYELIAATYDSTTDITTAEFRPYVPPTQRGRIRYYGGDMQELPDDGKPLLHRTDDIGGR